MTATLHELRERGYIRRGEGPGALLTLVLDAGGERWTLDGRPVHAGDGLEVLVWAERADCPSCDGEGLAVGDFAATAAGADVATLPRPRCPDCDGDGELYRGDWLRFRFEYANRGDGTGHALLYVQLWNGAGAERLALRVERGDLVRCRWPTTGEG